ncbi:MAG: DUF3486 family protein [Deltaproteobacteria bacterium]|nr:DUF3486 family protein [Deltaproteobacteria bacterium]
MAKNRRTHSVIDRLPQDLRAALMRMVVDNAWPHDWLGPTDGKPTYDDMVLYCSTQGYVTSRSAIARWAKRMQVYERMKTAGTIAREVMEGLSDENATRTQKAAAEIITAQIIELASAEDMGAKDIRNIATAVRDCTAVSMKADTYIRERVKKKAETAAKSTAKKLKKAGVNRRLIQEIIDEHLGVVK